MNESHLNTSKTMAIVDELRKILPTIETYNRGRSNMQLGEADGYTRLALANPTTQQAFSEEYNESNCRIRFAFPTVFKEYPHPMQETYLERYDFEGQLIGKPVNVEQLSADISLVVQLEIFSVLLITKGIEINDY